MAQSIPADVVTAAQAAQARYYVPSSVSIAQWAEESSYGTHMPKGSNNPFGIKAVAGQAYVPAMTWEVESGQHVRVEAKFAKYASLAEAFDAHAHLLAGSHLYKPAMDAWYRERDLETGVALMAQHYATDPAYATKLMSLIHQHDLVQYDSLPQDRARGARAITPTPSTPVLTPPLPQAGEGGVPADILSDLTKSITAAVTDTVGSVIAPAGPSPGSSAPQPAADATTETPPMNPLLIISIIQQVMTYAPTVEHILGNMPDIIAKGQAAIAALEKLDLATATVDAEAIFADLGITQAQVAAVVSHATKAAPPAAKAA